MVTFKPFVPGMNSWFGEEGFDFDFESEETIDSIDEILYDPLDDFEIKKGGRGGGSDRGGCRGGDIGKYKRRNMSKFVDETKKAIKKEKELNKQEIEIKINEIEKKITEIHDIKEDF